VLFFASDHVAMDGVRFYNVYEPLPHTLLRRLLVSPDLATRSVVCYRSLEQCSVAKNIASSPNIHGQDRTLPLKVLDIRIVIHYVLSGPLIFPHDYMI
jgi:hypothetical protein